MGILITFISLVFGIGIFLYIKRSEQKQWKISGEKDLKNQQYEHYKSIRLEDPVSEETINIATSLQEYGNHQKWLKEIIVILEEEYKRLNLDIFSDEGINLSQKHDDIDLVFSKSGQYEKICKYLHKKQIKELTEDIENTLKNLHNKDLSFTEADINDESKEELESLKNRVFVLTYEKKERSEIIKTLKKENADKKDFKIWCENNIWNITYLVDGELIEKKFKK